MPYRTSTGQGGFSLLEVLISALVMSVGLLGLAGLHSVGMRSNHGAYLRTQATVLAYDILDRMRSNPDQARDESYDIGSLTEVGADAGVDAEALSDDDTADIDLEQWKSDLAVLPSSDAVIDCDTDGLCAVTVTWDDAHSKIRVVEAGGDDVETDAGDDAGLASAGDESDDEGNDENDDDEDDEESASTLQSFVVRTRI